MRIVGNNPTLSRQTTATASGAISAAGKPLIVNTDGTVQVAGIETLTTTVGSATTFDSNAITSTDITFDSSNNKVVVSFQSGRTGDYGVARVGTVDASNNTISFGTETVFESAAVYYTSIDFDSTNNKVLIVYRDNGNSQYGTAIVGTVSGTDISFGSPTVFESAQTDYITTRFDPDNSKFLIVYKDVGNSNYGTAIVATISGTSVSFGSPTVYRSGQVDFNSCIYDTNANKFLVTYRNFGASGDGIVGTISGTSVSFGSATAFHSSGSTIYVNGTDQRYGMSFDSTANKILIAYIAYISSSIGYVVVGTISGTSVSFGSYVALGSALENERNEVAYDSNTNKHLLMTSDLTGSDTDGSDITNVREVTISGTTPTVGSKVLVSDLRESTNNALVFDSNAKKIVMAYSFGGNSNYGTANVVQTSGTQETLTTENFIGTSAHAAADGAKVLVNTQGAIDENQSGLTAGQPFFVDKNGALRLSTTVAASVGASVNVTSGGTLGEHPAITYDSNSNRYVAVFSDDGNSGYGTAVVVSVSGTTCSVGSSVVFSGSSKGTDISIAFDSNANKVLIAYRDQGNSNYGTAVVGTVDNSDNSISFGTPAVFESATAQYMGMDFDSNANKFVIAYRDGGNSGHGTAVVATISGTNVSFGTPVVFNAASNFTDPTPVTFDSSNNKVLISYRDSGNSNYGTSIVGTVSGTAISFGTEAVFESANSSVIGSAFDSSNNKVVIGYRDAGNSGHGTAVVATISSTSVSFGTPVVFNAAGIQYPDLAFSTQLNKVFIVYQDNETVVNGILGTVSGTSISFGSEISLSGASSGSSDSGERTELGVAFNTTDNNFVIISMPKDGSSATQVFAHTSEEDLSGSLSTDAVTAGTALSATKLLVKG